jgi:hypothetical protein
MNWAAVSERIPKAGHRPHDTDARISESPQGRRPEHPTEQAGRERRPQPRQSFAKDVILMACVITSKCGRSWKMSSVPVEKGSKLEH